MGAARENGRMRLLLVEDNAGDVRLIREALWLSGQDAEVSVARDGVEAITFLRRCAASPSSPRPDLILLDLNLPRKSGREVLAEVKSDERLQDIPVVVLTTSSAEEDIAYSYRTHANSYVIKPVSLDQLVEVIGSIGDYWTHIARLPGGHGIVNRGG